MTETTRDAFMQNVWDALNEKLADSNRQIVANVQHEIESAIAPSVEQAAASLRETFEAALKESHDERLDALIAQVIDGLIDIYRPSQSRDAIKLLKDRIREMKGKLDNDAPAPMHQAVQTEPPAPDVPMPSAYNRLVKGLRGPGNGGGAAA